ncbi:uncharacterized protein [Henckelia pumila]|uniref:uncharacterized protein isoform X2 n=1 Tax=Henckelia pumila TaxID=405737 RepID=UPI003C6DB85D
MEGVGARLGRSSTRYGPTTVFTGPVRKWKKKWVPIAPSNSSHHNSAAAAAGNRTANGSNVSPHLLLYQWTPITPSQNKDNGNTANNNGNVDSKNSNKDEVVAVEDPPKKKFKYIPKNESSEQADDETKPFETDAVEATSKSDEYNEKPDINDVPIDENQNTSVERQDLNESTLDLSLG